MKRKMRMHNIWARKDGKQYCSHALTYSITAATRLALKQFPKADGYTDHFGQRAHN